MTELASSAHGHHLATIDDVAELFHEVSSWYPTTHRSEVARASVMSDPEMTVLPSGATKHYEGCPRIKLVAAAALDTSLSMVLERRRSTRAFGTASLGEPELAAVIQAAVGRGRASLSGVHRRPGPSAGALYPLEAYVLALNCDRLPTGIFHVDPYAFELEQLPHPLDEDDVAQAFISPDARFAQMLLIVSAMFWRSRFKYGSRGYRFCLLEAGHVVQNVLLACESLRLSAFPIGGFYDARVNRLLGIDGLHEAALYAVALGTSWSSES